MTNLQNKKQETPSDCSAPSKLVRPAHHQAQSEFFISRSTAVSKTKHTASCDAAKPRFRPLQFLTAHRRLMSPYKLRELKACRIKCATYIQQGRALWLTRGLLYETHKHRAVPKLHRNVVSTHVARYRPAGPLLPLSLLPQSACPPEK